MSSEGTADLCRWLRDNSSGIYRNAAVAAVVIDSQHAELISRQSEIDRLTRELAEAKRAAQARADVDDTDVVDMPNAATQAQAKGE